MKKLDLFKCLHCGEVMELAITPELCIRCERVDWDEIPETWEEMKLTQEAVS